jgi:hypothetical protein
MSKHTMTLTKKQWQVMHDCLLDYWNLTINQPDNRHDDIQETFLSKKAHQSMNHIFKLLGGDV